MQFLLDRGADTDIPDGVGNTSVHVAVSYGAKNAMTVLLRKGANPDIINYDGEAPLHIAATKSNQECLDILLRCGALVNISSHQLVTPLMLAAKSGKSDLVTALLEFDAKVDDKDATGNTAEDYANDKKKILECLKRFDKSHKPVTSFPSKVEKDADLPSETENDQFGLPFAAGGSPRLGDIDETLQKDDLPASDLSTWDDSVPSSPLPGQGSQLVKSKGMFDLSKFMVGSDKESIKSDNPIKLNSLDKNIHNSDRKD